MRTRQQILFARRIADLIEGKYKTILCPLELEKWVYVGSSTNRLSREAEAMLKLLGKYSAAINGVDEECHKLRATKYYIHREILKCVRRSPEFLQQLSAAHRLLTGEHIIP